MLITYSIQMDLKNRGMTPVVYAVQNEGVSRAIELVLKDGGASWDVPVGTAAAIRFRKSDGKGGIYDTLPDDSPAYNIDGNKVTFYLAPQVLTSDGIATVQLVLMQGNDVLCSFGVHINVEADVSLGEQGSEDYVNLTNLMLEQIENYFATHPDAGLSMLLLPNISGEGVLSHDVYISDFQIPPGFAPKQGDLVLHSDGYLGYIQSVDHEIDNTISVVMLSPPVSLKGKQGDRGNDGTSVTHSWDGTVLTINSASGTSHSDLKGEKGDKGDSIKGDKGDPGVAGTSVTVESVSESAVDGGSNVITFSDGKTVTIKNGKTGTPGKDGADGQPGKDGQDGKDYVLTNADKTEIAEMASELVDVPDVDVTGVVKSVNGVAPDDNGNVEITIPEGNGGADWLAKEGEAGYIKNSPLIEETTENLILHLDTFEGESYEADGTVDLLVDGAKYKVEWNGTESDILTATYYPAEGNHNALYALRGETLVLSFIPGENCLFIEMVDGSNDYPNFTNLNLYKYSAVWKIDSKYLPEGIGGGTGKDGKDGEDGYSVFYTSKNFQPNVTVTLSESLVETYGRTLRVGDMILSPNNAFWQITAVNSGNLTLERKFYTRGDKGDKGEKGDPGDDYVLTPADKTEIAKMAAELVDVPEGSGTVSGTLLPETEISQEKLVYGFDINTVPLGEKVAVIMDGKPYITTHLAFGEGVDELHWIGNIAMLAPEGAGTEYGTGEPFFAQLFVSHSTFFFADGASHKIAICTVDVLDEVYVNALNSIGNMSGGSGSFVVNVTIDEASTPTSADKTYEAISGALESGMSVVAVAGDLNFPYVGLNVDNGSILFAFNGGTQDSAELILILSVTPENVWNLTMKDFITGETIGMKYVSINTFNTFTKGVAKVQTATVGQTIKVKSVDDNGVPTAWEAVDMPSGGGAQSDWNQNDPSAPDYVKNRPFWTSDPVKTVLFDGVAYGKHSPQVDAPIAQNCRLEVGNTCECIYDGESYTLTASIDRWGYTYAGSYSLWNSREVNPVEPPFAFGVVNSNLYFVSAVEGEHVLKISSVQTEVCQIDEKYLPVTAETPIVDLSKHISLLENPIDINHDEYEDMSDYFPHLTGDKLVDFRKAYDWGLQHNAVFYVFRNGHVVDIYIESSEESDNGHETVVLEGNIYGVRYGGQVFHGSYQYYLYVDDNGVLWGKGYYEGTVYQLTEA